MTLLFHIHNILDSWFILLLSLALPMTSELNGTTLQGDWLTDSTRAMLFLTQQGYVNAYLTHWGRVTHICVGKLTIIGPDNGLSPERRQAIIWTNAAILLIGTLGTNFSEILIEIQAFSLKKIRLKMSSAKCCSFRLCLNVLTCVHTKLQPRI